MIKILKLSIFIMCIAIIGSLSGAPQKANMPSMMDELSLRPMSDDEARYEKISKMAYRPAWAPMPVLKEHPELISLLHKSLSSPDAASRMKSIFALGQIGSSSSKKLILQSLNDKNETVRLHAGIALACMGDAKGISACESALSKQPRWLKYYAIWGLWNINNSKSKAILKKYSSNRDVLVGPAVRGALADKFVSTPKMKAKKVTEKLQTINETWESAANILSEEADWWWHKGNYEQAIRCHEAAILLDPGYAESYSIVAWLHWSKDRNEEAISTLKRGIVAAPNDPMSHYNLGYHLYNTKEYKKAEPYLKKSVQLGGDHLVKRVYAYDLEKLGKFEQSLFQWKEIVKSRPDDLSAKRQMEKLQSKIK